MHRIIKALGIIAILVLLTGVAQADDLSTINIGYQPSTHQIAAMLASEKGWWEEDLDEFGVEKVVMKEFPSGPPEMHAMLAGDLDVAYVGVAPPIAAMYEGLDEKIVAGVQTQGSALVIRPELADEYEGPQSLKGKKIATFPPGSIQHTVLSKWLLDNGIDPEKDVDIKAMGSSDAATAIGAKTVDAVFLASPTPTIIVEEGKGVIVGWSGSMWPNHACCCVVASGKMLREHPDIVTQIIKTHIRATEYEIEHPEEAAEIYAKWLDADVSTIKQSINVTDMHWIHDPSIEVESGLEYAKVIYELNRERYEGKGIEVLEEEDIFDTSFYDEIMSTPTPTPIPIETPSPIAISMPTTSPTPTPTHSSSPYIPSYILGAAAVIVILIIAGKSRRESKGKSAKRAEKGITLKEMQFLQDRTNGKKGDKSTNPPPLAEPLKPETEPVTLIKKETPPPISEPITIERAIRKEIRAIRSSIEEAKSFGYDVSVAESRLNDAKFLFTGGSNMLANKYAKQAEEEVKRIKEESKPEITTNLSETSFKAHTWKRIDLTIKNSGTAPAKKISVQYPKDRVAIGGLIAIEKLKPNEEKKLRIGFRPIHAGEVPLTATITYMDLDNKEYKGEQSFWISVGEEPLRRVGKYEIPTEKKEIALTIERAIYDPCKRDFIEGRLPRMKEWINRYDPGAYWFAVSIQNNTDRAIEEWGVELETSSALTIKEAKIEGIEERIPQESHLGIFKLSVSKAHGYTIPERGSRRVYFKLRADKPKTTYEISGVFKSEITGEVPIRAKEFKYLCDTGVSPEAMKVELEKIFSKRDAARLALSFKTVQEIDRMCDQEAKTEEYLNKLSSLKGYTEGFSDTFTTQVAEFSRFMKQEQLEYLDEVYKGKVKRFCTNLVDVWISEFLKG